MQVQRNSEGRLTFTFDQDAEALSLIAAHAAATREVFVGGAPAAFCATAALTLANFHTFAQTDVVLTGDTLYQQIDQECRQLVSAVLVASVTGL